MAVQSPHPTSLRSAAFPRDGPPQAGRMRAFMYLCNSPLFVIGFLGPESGREGMSHTNRLLLPEKQL